MLNRAFTALKATKEEGSRESNHKVGRDNSVLHSCEGEDSSSGASIFRSGDPVDREEVSRSLLAVQNFTDSAPMNGTDSHSKRELELKERVVDLVEELNKARTDDRNAQLLLATSRIRALGMFLCNPFNDDETGKSQQASWLATAVRKEKARMGSTGNKRKVVTAFDILERNDTFYNADIECLIEGLPGSEFCDPYIFQAYRTATGINNRTWIHEAQIKNESETILLQKKAKAAHAMKEEVETEREIKKRKRDELRDSRKLQKLAEEEEKKKARVDERLSRLEVQIKDRLFREASFQREKVILAKARSLTKEFNRRRKVAELVAGQAVADRRRRMCQPPSPTDREPLPCISKVYDEDTIRVWNFISTFKAFFLQRGYVQHVPSLESLQNAINCVRGFTESSCGNQLSIDDAVASLTDLAVALCKPLAASLTRVLFASLIALNPSLQRDFGAEFFKGINTTPSAIDDSIDAGDPDVLLPVNSLTWQEIARLAFLSDALGEMGYTRQEAAHLLRGYRSAGHPNSKESKRLRKIEDLSISILRQKVSEIQQTNGIEFFPRDKIRIVVPCSPFSQDKPVERTTFGKWPFEWGQNTQSISNCSRRSMGLLNWLTLNSSEYRKLTSIREQYMEDALTLKEEMERAKIKEDDDEEEEDEEEEDEEEVVVEDHLHSSENSTTRLVEGPKQLTTCPAPALDIVSEQYKDANAGGSCINTEKRIGKETSYGEFFRDVEAAPEAIRRCLAVLRTLSVTGPAEPFIYPVDPQTNPGYYDMVVRPMCLREVGKQLHAAASRLQNYKVDDNRELEQVVVQFGRNVRLIALNCLSYSNAGPTVIAAGTELLRIFERLLFDWVLAPQDLLPSLYSLDDDKCVEYHNTDEEATVLL